MNAEKSKSIQSHFTCWQGRHLVSATLPETIDMLAILQAIYVFLSVNGPRHELFLRAQVEANLKVLELERLA